jgi:hypothetical protein
MQELRKTGQEAKNKVSYSSVSVSSILRDRCFIVPAGQKANFPAR